VLAFTGLDAMRAIHARGRVYYPLFLGLALARSRPSAWRSGGCRS
jgi:hypothetical protein